MSTYEETKIQVDEYVEMLECQCPDATLQGVIVTENNPTYYQMYCHDCQAESILDYPPSTEQVKEFYRVDKLLYGEYNDEGELRI